MERPPMIQTTAGPINYTVNNGDPHHANYYNQSIAQARTFSVEVLQSLANQHRRRVFAEEDGPLGVRTIGWLEPQTAPTSSRKT